MAAAGHARSDSKPVIAVLPFDNMSGDAEQQYFSDGITGDIIDRLARYRILAVIGHQSTFAMRGQDADLSALREKLSADYVVAGTVRKAGNRIRIVARLTDMQTEMRCGLSTMTGRSKTSSPSRMR